MRKVLISLYLYLGLSLTLILSCTFVNDLSGSAGAGNPVMLSMLAEGADSEALLQRINQEQADRTFAQELHIHDHDKRRINVQKVYISVQRIYFPIPENCDITAIEKPLYIEANKLVLDGPFVFDLLKGTSTPPLEVFQLPFGLYNSITMDIEPIDTSEIPAELAAITKGYPITLCGNFIYEDTLRNLNLYILNDKPGTFSALGGSINLTIEDTVGLLVKLNEQTWLNSISIQNLIKLGLLQIDPNGDFFFIGDPSGQGPGPGKARKIRDNIFSSGIFTTEN